MNSNLDILGLVFNLINYLFIFLFLFNLLKVNYYNSNSIYDWIPTGRSEKSVLINRDQFVDLLTGKNE